jgi:hypothetical protein
MANMPWVILEVMPRMTVKFARMLSRGRGKIESVWFNKFSVGYGWISGTAPNFTLQAPPIDVNAVPGQIYEGTLPLSAISWDASKSLIKCLIPKAAVSVPTQISTIAIIDNEGDVLGAGSFLPGWVVPDGEFEIACLLEMSI